MKGREHLGNEPDRTIVTRLMTSGEKLLHFGLTLLSGTEICDQERPLTSRSTTLVHKLIKGMAEEISVYDIEQLEHFLTVEVFAEILARQVKKENDSFEVGDAVVAISALFHEVDNRLLRLWGVRDDILHAIPTDKTAIQFKATSLDGNSTTAIVRYSDLVGIIDRYGGPSGPGHLRLLENGCTTREEYTKGLYNNVLCKPSPLVATSLSDSDRSVVAYLHSKLGANSQDIRSSVLLEFMRRGITIDFESGEIRSSQGEVVECLINYPNEKSTSSSPF